MLSQWNAYDVSTTICWLTARGKLFDVADLDQERSSRVQIDIISLRRRVANPYDKRFKIFAAVERPV